MAIYENITELIGNTPIVKLNRLVPEGAADVYVKLEAFNPGSSVKDRIALSMIEKAEADGLIKPGDTIVEATSGNTGIGLSWVGAAKGYKVVIVMPETMSVERRKIIQAEAIAAERNGFLPLQFENPANPEVHERTTGQEIVDAFGKDGLDAFVAGVGTGGTVSGISHTLKKNNPAVKVYAVEANESAVLSGEKPGPHKIQGISAGFIPNTLDTNAYDGVRRVSSEEAFELARAIGGAEGFLVGISSAAAIYAAIEVAKELGSGKKVLALAPDNGERYLSTTLYEFE